jgi:ribosome-binding factor A
VVREIVATFFTGGTSDSRIGLITVTRVDVTPDLSRAVVHYTVHGDAAEREKTAEGLTRATPAVRREVGRQLQLRVVPEIVFAHDAGHDHASRIEELLAQIKREGEGSPS